MGMEWVQRRDNKHADRFLNADPERVVFTDYSFARWVAKIKVEKLRYSK